MRSARPSSALARGACGSEQANARRAEIRERVTGQTASMIEADLASRHGERIRAVLRCVDDAELQQLD